MRTKSSFKTVVPTMVLALMLQMMPLPDWLDFVRPDFVTLVVMYWVLVMPERVGVTMAWCVGLLLDVTQGAILGQHALGLVLVTYILQLEYQRIRVFSLVQQALVVFVLLLIKQIMVLWVYGLVGHAPSLQLYFLPSLIGAIIWPWVYLILRSLQHKFTVSHDF